MEGAIALGGGELMSCVILCVESLVELLVELLLLVFALVEVLVADDVVFIFVVVSSPNERAGHNKHAVIIKNRFM